MNQLFPPPQNGPLKDRLVACVGAMLGIALTCFICWLLFGEDGQLPFIIAPMGASAVLIFVVPKSPLAQPWPVIVGNTVSALAGVVVGKLVGQPFLAAGTAVSLAILAMTVTQSLHPPGGAVALSPIVGGAAISNLGFQFPLVVVAGNAIALVAVAVLFHKLMRQEYPHKPVSAPPNLPLAAHSQGPKSS